MKTNAALLSSALRVLKQLVVHHASLPVLDQIRLEAKDNQLTVEGTDLDTRIRFTLPCIDDLKAILVPFKRFATLLEAAGGKRGDVSFEIQGRRVVVSVNGRSFQLDTPIPPEEYPSPLAGPKAPKAVTYTDPEDLAAGLDWLLPAVSTDATRTMLTGVSFAGEHIACCDGHRLHRVEGAPRLDGEGLLPAPAARVLLSFLKVCAPWVVHGLFGDGTFAFEGTGEDVTCTLVSKAIEGTFPDIEEVIPREDKTAAKVSLPELDAALALAAKVSHRGEARLLLNGALVIEASDVDDGGSVQERVEAVRTHGQEDVIVCAMIAYLRDALSTESESAIVGFTDERSPITVRFSDDDRRLAVIMPLRM